jgi:tRNA U55 pseudouridine synthase TruB
MKELRRTKQGDFSIEYANSMEEIESGNISFVSLEKALNELKIIEVDDYLEKRISNGSILENRYDEDKIAFKNKDNEIIAIYEVYEKDKNKIKPLKVFAKNM